jgi:hypothetical protein
MPSDTHVPICELLKFISARLIISASYLLPDINALGVQFSLCL